MTPKSVAGNVQARCPDCGGAVTTFEFQYGNSKEYGAVVVDEPQTLNRPSARWVYQLLRCAGCGRGGMAVVGVRGGRYAEGKLLSFSPRTIEMAPLPQSVPEGIVNEFREAEVCASAGSFRAALALLRSVLEKTLKANGYTKRHLKDNIDDAAADGMITAARSRKAHSELRDLGNDVLHDKWRVVVEDEVEAAHRYAQRILEDLYDDRPGVEATLREKGRTFAITTSEEK